MIFIYLSIIVLIGILLYIYYIFKVWEYVEPLKIYTEPLKNKKKNNITFVISRYNENINWTEQLIM